MRVRYVLLVAHADPFDLRVAVRDYLGQVGVTTGLRPTQRSEPIQTMPAHRVFFEDRRSVLIAHIDDIATD